MSDVFIKVHATHEQKKLIERAANSLSKNYSDFMLEAACDRAQSVVLDHAFGSIGSDKFKQFISILDAPPGANPGLERLMSVKAPWHSSET